MNKQVGLVANQAKERSEGYNKSSDVCLLVRPKHNKRISFDEMQIIFELQIREYQMLNWHFEC